MSKIFQKVSSDFISKRKEEFLHEFSLFKISHQTKKPVFLRLYETCMLISKQADFSHFRVALYEFSILAHLILCERTSDIVTVQIVSDSNTVEFTSPNLNDLKVLGKFLKKKLNLLGLHQTFKCEKLIGKGNFANVYLGTEIRTKEGYAIKALTKAFILSQKLGLASLINEINLLRAVEHPNLIHLDSVYETDNTFYLVLDICSGGNLKEYLQKHKFLPQNKAILVMKSVLEGLQAMHSKNIMHRDVKPDNILFKTPEFLEKKNQIILADFGLASSNDVPKYLYHTCGTPGFVAPEILQNNDPKSSSSSHYSVKCDLFSVGITLYVMLTGRLPYEGTDNLLIENMKFDYDLNKYEGFGFLSKKAQHLLSKLLCPVEKRYSAAEALNHSFFKPYGMDCEFIEEEMGMNENVAEENSLAATNLCEFNARERFCLENTNKMQISPCCSPIFPKFGKDKTISFISITPTLNGFTKTFSQMEVKNSDEDDLKLKSSF